VYICGSYRKIKTGVPLFGPPGIHVGLHVPVNENSLVQGYT